MCKYIYKQSCKLIEKYKDKDGTCPKHVRDVIPESRLSKYGNYEYNEERERIYRSENDDIRSINKTLHFYAKEITEPWMLPDVEEHFARLITGNVKRANTKLLAVRYFQFKCCP